MSTLSKQKTAFTPYEIFVVAIIAFIQFTVILDFMVLSPLSAILLKEFDIDTAQFGLVVSAYAISAGVSGFFAAGFADKFDRKKLLMFFYTGFVIGTLLCAIAPNYEFLLFARIVTGIFGGVIGSISMAIVTDLFKLEVRGRVMGIVQTAFAVSQIMGIPVGLWLATNFGWNWPFWMIVGVSSAVGVVMMVYLKPVNAHLQFQRKQNPVVHLLSNLVKPDHLRGFAASIMLATGGYMLMPLGAAFSTHNLGISITILPLLYLITGLFSITFGPLSGFLSDKLGKLNVFIGGCLIALVMVGIFTQMETTPLWLAIVVNVILFAGLTARMVAASALISAVPAPQDRGAFMGINNSLQQFSGGISAGIAGVIVVKEPSGWLSNYEILGYVVMVSLVGTIVLMYFVNRMVNKRISSPPTPLEKGVKEAEAAFVTES
jgi:predicted MFS family arabinose efflux permease